MILYDTKYLQLKSTKTNQGDNWVYAHRPNITGVVVILPIIQNKKILFLLEERPPLKAENISKYSIALPAGLVGDERQGETPIEAIKSELLEETGLIADKIDIKINKVASSAGCTSETYTIAFAYINNYKILQKPVNDGEVIVDRILVDIKNVRNWLKKQEKNDVIITSQLLSALYYLTEEYNL